MPEATLTPRPQRHQGPRWHYAWAVVAVTFLTLLTAAGVRSAPGVLIRPLEAEFGWDRATISLAVAVSILTFGIGAPIAGALLDRIGPRRVMLAGMFTTSLGLAPLLLLRDIWQLYLFWGLIIGIGTGAVSGSLGATVSARWFKAHRGLMIGLFGAATSTGQLIFLPALMGLTMTEGWRAAIALLAVASALLLVPIILLMRDHPADVGLRPVGDDGTALTTAQRAEETRRTSLAQAVRTHDFWLLAGSFFVCGFTTNGLIGTHLIPHAVESGFPETMAAGTVALMGGMNVVGTLGSGWLTDRWDNRKLLATYYAFRGLSLAALPFIMDVPMLLLFAVVYGLDWIATVPPTANLTATIFGRASLGTLYGWIFFSHMVGASLAAYAGGYFREVFGNYQYVFLSAATLGIVASGLVLRIGRPPAAAPSAPLAPAAA